MQPICTTAARVPKPVIKASSCTVSITRHTGKAVVRALTASKSRSLTYRQTLDACDPLQHGVVQSVASYPQAAVQTAHRQLDSTPVCLSQGLLCSSQEGSACGACCLMSIMQVPLEDCSCSLEILSS